MRQVPVKGLYNGQVEVRDAGDDHNTSNGKKEYLSFFVELQSNFRETGASGSFIPYPGSSLSLGCIFATKPSKALAFSRRSDRKAWAKY